MSRSRWHRRAAAGAVAADVVVLGVTSTIVDEPKRSLLVTLLAGGLAARDVRGYVIPCSTVLPLGLKR